MDKKNKQTNTVTTLRIICSRRATGYNELRNNVRVLWELYVDGIEDRVKNNQLCLHGISTGEGFHWWEEGRGGI